jgi:ligand-binding SRPBCC domain-containing protein
VAQVSRFESAVEIAAPIEMVHGFHLDTRNARLISPPGTDVVEVVGTFPVAAGSVVTMRLRQRPIPVATTWRLRIEALERPTLVVDVAERSPFAYWRHEHVFESLGPGRTLMTDRLSYRLPLGPLGRLADRLVVRRRLTRTFAQRHALTRDLLEGRARRAGVVS